MARDGSGTYSLASGNPVVTGTTISSTTFNNTMSDIATALTASIAKDGQTTPTANLPMGTYIHTGVGNATARTHYCSAAQAQDGGLTYLTSVGGPDFNTITATGAISMSAYATGQVFRFISAGANTGAATLNINSIGAKAITRDGTTALAAGDIASGQTVEVIYDGTRFQLVNPAQISSSNIPAGTVTYADIQDISATSRILGRKTSGAGDTEECTLSEVLDFIGSAAQGDILYRGASGWERLVAGTAGYYLKTQGAGANPIWAAVSSGPFSSSTAYESSAITMPAAGGAITPVAHGFAGRPKIIQVFFRCVKVGGAMNYAENDEVLYSHHNNHNGTGITVWSDATNINLRLGNSNLPYLADASSGSSSAITGADWKIIIRAYY